jgi:hypothetical protein
LRHNEFQLTTREEYQVEICAECEEYEAEERGECEEYEAEEINQKEVHIWSLPNHFSKNLWDITIEITITHILVTDCRMCCYIYKMVVR